MTQKVLKVGSSAGITIPNGSLKELGIKIGDRVKLRIDKNRRTVFIQPVDKISKRQERIAKLTLDFIEKYRSDLESLARR